MRKRYDFTKSLIKRAGAFLLSHRAERRNVFDKSANDYVTQADRECEHLITSAIREAFPEDGFYCEESGEENGSSGYTWVIDPIDGTVNFMNSFPLYTISIALCRGSEAVMGCVYVPEYDELFSSVKGEGAFLNEERIHVSSETNMKRSLALCVPPHRMHEHLPYYMERYDRVLRAVSDIRSIGSAALSLCYVASGRCSIYYELGLHAYDFAAGALILTEAGGSFRYERRGEVMYDIKSSCPQFFESLLEMTR